MLKKRLIPVLFLKNGLVVRSQEFVDFREMGNPINQLERLSDWLADEIIYIDITRDGIHDIKRDDHKIRIDSNIISIIRHISKSCFMPLTFGGRIRDFETAATYIRNGADKVVVNTGAYKTPELITKLAEQFGSQAVVVGIDVKVEDEKHVMYVNQGQERTDENPVAWAKKAASLGAGEIFVNSIDRDGTANGYDIEIIRQISDAVEIPVIACGGAGMFDDFAEVMTQTKASAVAAGNIFNFTENAYRRAKRFLHDKGYPVRMPAEHRL